MVGSDFELVADVLEKFMVESDKFMSAQEAKDRLEEYLNRLYNYNVDPGLVQFTRMLCCLALRVSP